MEFFNENPTITIAIGVVLISFIIGFFGDKRLKKKKEMKQMLSSAENQKTKDSTSNETITSSDLPTAEKNNVSSSPADNVNYGQDAFSNPEQDNLNKGDLNAKDSTPINQNMTYEQPVSTNDNTMINNIFNNTTQEASSEISPYDYPSENKPQEAAPSPVAFDGQLPSDDNFNNMF